MFKPQEIINIRLAIDECKKMNYKNAHVVEYFFWQAKKDALWYWFPRKKESYYQYNAFGRA